MKINFSRTLTPVTLKPYSKTEEEISVSVANYYGSDEYRYKPLTLDLQSLEVALADELVKAFSERQIEVQKTARNALWSKSTQPFMLTFGTHINNPYHPAQGNTYTTRLFSDRETRTGTHVIQRPWWIPNKKLEIYTASLPEVIVRGNISYEKILGNEPLQTLEALTQFGAGSSVVTTPEDIEAIIETLTPENIQKIADALKNK